MNQSNMINNRTDKTVFNVVDPDLNLTRAVQRMEIELPIEQPITCLKSLPPIKPFPVSQARNMILRKTIPDLPPLPVINQASRPSKDVLLDNDDELKALLDKRDVRTLVVGVGGAGNNMISRFQHLGLANCRTMVINTDVQDLYYSNADEKVLIGKRLTRGLGSGNNYEIGEMAAAEDYERLKAVLNADIVFLSCGLGGGTGTGATPLVARAAQDNGAVVVSVVTLPFEMEGSTKRTIAYDGLKRLTCNSDTIIPLPNQKLLSLVPNIKIHQGFKIMDEILIRSARSVIDLITKPGLVNLDFADIKSIIEKPSNKIQDATCSTSVIGMTEVTNASEDHLSKYTTKALKNPLIEPETSEIKNALVGIMGDFNVNLRQVNTVVSTVQKQIHPDANVKWGFIQDPSLSGKIRITVLGTGFKSPELEVAFNGAAF